MDAVIRSGGQISRGSELIVDPYHGQARMSIRPLDHTLFGQVLGHYRIAARAPSGGAAGITATLGAASTLFSFRWTDASRFCVLQRVAVAVGVIAAVTTQVVMDCDVKIARIWTAADSGGTNLTPSAQTVTTSQKNRTTMGPSLLGDCRIHTTGALTAGTRTLDNQAFGGGAFKAMVPFQAAGMASDMMELYRWLGLGEYPIVFSQNEGFIMENITAGPATGTIGYAVVVEWAEMAAF